MFFILRNYLSMCRLFSSAGNSLFLLLVRFKFSHSSLEFRAEVSDEALYWPRGSISQSTNSVSLDLLSEFPQHVNLLWLRIACSESLHRLVQPRCTFSTRRALSTALVLIEDNEPRNGL